MMQQQSLIERAKQGDVRAISALINHQLQPKGIVARAIFKENCLQIVFESQ
jgi:hypothetical protein